MARHTLKLFFAAASLVLLLTACNNNPDPNFEHKLQQAQEKEDVYAALTTLPRQSNYARAESGLRQALASQEALSLRARYDSLLKKLDADTAVARAANLLAACRASFAEAVAFQTDDKVDAQTAGGAGSAVFQGLTSCRQSALQLQKDASTADQVAAPLLRRFASTGMVLVSVATIAHGDETAGLGMWRQADTLAAQDRPEFKITPQMFKP